jgi:hypothetical protein
MDQVKVIWKTYNPEAIPRGYWDQGILEDLFGKRPHQWQHQNDFSDLAKDEGAVVIINGRMHEKYTNAINHDLEKLRWVVLILTGDEESVFPFELIKHPLIRIWVQLPRMNRHNDVSYKLVNGYRTGTHTILRNMRQPEQRIYDWSFVGQVNHARREQCIEATKQLPEWLRDKGRLETTTAFGQEKLDHAHYLEVIRLSKVVLCPSGIETPDTFRLYEALEAGCVPIVDAFATKNQDSGFWQYLFGEQPPFPIVDYWDKLPALLPTLLQDWPHNSNKVFAWWQDKKRQMDHKLMADIAEVSR